MLLQLYELSLSFHFSFLPPCFFFSLQLHHSHSLCFPYKSYTHREESTISLIHLLCNPFFIFFPCKPSGQLLLLCSESANLLHLSKNILLIFVLLPLLESHYSCIYSLWKFLFQDKDLLNNHKKALWSWRWKPSPKLKHFSIVFSLLSLSSFILQWLGWLNTSLLFFSFNIHSQAHEWIIQYAAGQ